MPFEHIFRLPFVLWILLGIAGWILSYPLVLHQKPDIKKRRFIYLMIMFGVWLLVFGMGIEYDKSGTFNTKSFLFCALILTFGLYSTFKATRCCGSCGKIVSWNSLPPVHPVNTCPRCKAALDHTNNLLNK
jgi:hypothetical protein